MKIPITRSRVLNILLQGVLYAAVVITYFAAVLLCLGDWLKDLFNHARLAYAVVSIFLIIGQAAFLEVSNVSIARLLERWRR